MKKKNNQQKKTKKKNMKTFNKIFTLLLKALKDFLCLFSWKWKDHWVI